MKARRWSAVSVLLGSAWLLAVVGLAACIVIDVREPRETREPHEPREPEAPDGPVVAPPATSSIGHEIVLEPVDVVAQLEATMTATAQQLAAGDSSAMGEVYVPAPDVVSVPPDSLVASEVFGEPDDDLSNTELESCTSFPYLVERQGSQAVLRNGQPLYNSFSWWGKQSSMPSTGALLRQFECEFNKPIVTIVGADTAELAARGYKYVTDWGTTQASSPSSMPGVRFTVRRHSFTPDGPQSDPRFETRSVFGSDGRRRERRVLVNRGYPPSGIQLPASQQRPSLFLDFEIPQRAVGLEIGFVLMPAIRNDRPHTEDVKLIAYDASGNPIRSGGQVLETHARRIRSQDSRLDVDTVTHRLGVVDQEARIRSVELRFGLFDIDNPAAGMIVEPQVVYRVWHEPLPHAAVKQGSATTQYGPGDQDIDPVTVDLPYDCDKAVVFLRGFKSWYSDRQAREVTRIGASIQVPGREPTSIYDIYASLPAVTTWFSTDPGGTIEFAAAGGATSGEIQSRSVTVYYTVLAWDSTQVDLYPRHDASSSRTEDSFVRNRLELADARCPNPASGDCGELFGALQAFGFSVWAYWDIQEIDHVWLAAGQFHGHASGGGWALANPLPAMIGTNAYRTELLSRNPDGSISWQFSSSFEGDDQDRHIRNVEGTVLAGPSLRTAPLPFFVFTNREPGRRPDAETFFMNVHDVRANGAVPQLDADVAFVGMEGLLFQPDDQVAEMELEVRGEVYDGDTIDWQMGGGLDTSSNNSDSGQVFGAPAFGGVVRNDHVAKPRIEVQDVVCESVVDIRRASDRLGLVRNVGSASVVIDELWQSSYLPVDQQFEAFLLWQGSFRSVSQIQGLLPLRLDPGDQFLVGARYTPTAPAGFGSPPHVSRLHLRTNSAVQPRVSLRLLGFARAPDPGCAWIPELLDFGSARVAPHSLHAALASTGSTPLLLDDLRLEHGNRGFSFRPAPHQIESDLLVVIVDWAGSQQARLQLFGDRLIAETNAGPCVLDLIAGGVRASPPGGPGGN